jgi:hypothetical protein
MDNRRQIRRIEVDIPVTVSTVLETCDASIADLTEMGVQLHGISLAEGTRFRIDYMGQTLFAQCRWSEVDRLGAKFLFPLTDGALYERLQIARTAQIGEDGNSSLHLAMAPIHHGQTTRGARTFGRAMPAGQFGRRG